MKIIDADIRMWQATFETHTSQLCRCPVSHEVEFSRKRLAASNVLAALKEYKSICDSFSPLPGFAPFDKEPFV